MNGKSWQRPLPLVTLYKAQWIGLGKDEHHHCKIRRPSTSTSDVGSPRIKAPSHETLRNAQIINCILKQLKQNYWNTKIWDK